MAQSSNYQSNRNQLAGQSNRSVVGLALGMAALFFAIVAILINTPILFYMGTALIATIGASRLQAWLSVRGLRFEREAPDAVKVGDWVTINIVVWSERKLRRPLITVADTLPGKLIYSDKTVSTPIAPAFDLPIRTQYRFRPQKRGVYKWSGIEAVGTDALGLVVMTKVYDTEPVELTVLPRPIPISVELPVARGWGISEAESGQSRGAGLEPRGVREFVSGDSLRHVHWASTARRGQLLVKEFEAGSHSAVSLVIQRIQGSDLGIGADTTLETMCGHAVFLAEQLMQQGALVQFPTLEGRPNRSSGAERVNEIYELVARVQAELTAPLSAEIGDVASLLPTGSILILMLSVADRGVVSMARQLRGKGVQVVAMLYSPAEFKVTRLPHQYQSADDPRYMDELESAGVLVRLASKHGEAL
ncbi:MAG: hypothetical protein BGO01_03835 [Armatimonadetes bacterium 55-13]|nr:DUF58 domain-containing protein [Armatimonadota bacterium]OJU63282.1 MAG: hypothetical protein BGO01_03835 [Armatimonadetes bacterium 55-13]